MADFTRSAKSVNDWTPDDLEAYNISVRSENAPTFFEVEHTSKVPQIDNESSTKEKGEDMIFERNAILINLLRLVEGSAVTDFVRELFIHIGYSQADIVARTHKALPLVICGERKSGEADICLIDCLRYQIILVVQENKPGDTGTVFTESRLIAGAIAAFDSNNLRRRSQHEVPLESAVIPGIVMVGTTPIFYKIPVTVTLRNHVARGTYPSSPTIVTSYLPDVPRPAHRYEEGMKPLDSRQAIIQSFEAFKKVVGI